MYCGVGNKHSENFEMLLMLKAHSASPHMQAYRINVMEYVRGV